MQAKEFTRMFYKAIKRRNDIDVERHCLTYLRGTYSFLRVASSKILPNDKIILLLAGFHGNETAGPLTILHNVNTIIDCIHARNLKILLYPLCNPSGFEIGARYNIDSAVESKRSGNNDFLRYELDDGMISGDIGESNQFRQWHWSSDPRLNILLPQETQLLHTLLKKDPLLQVIACIDLHQDYITPHATAYAYHYAYGELTRYKHIIQKIENLLPILRNQEISAGYASGLAIKSDAQGFIVRHDGTVSDLMYRIGAEHSIAIETTGATEFRIAEQANLIWIFGITDIVAAE